MMREAKREIWYDGYLVGKNNYEVSMLQYTDGTIFVGEVNVKNIFTIKAILRLFEVIFGLRMNFHKSSFGTIGVELGEIERYANLLNCRILSIPLFT